MPYQPPPPGSGGASSSGSGNNPFGASQERANFPVLTEAPHRPTTQEQLQGINSGGNGTFVQSHDLTGRLFGLSPDEIANLQKQLALAGYAPRTLHADGVVDAATVSGYQDLLADVNQYNKNGQLMTPDELLQQKVAGTQAADAAAKAAKRAAGIGVPNGSLFHTTNPLDINQTAQQVAQQELGRKLNPKQLAQFVAVYHGIEAHKNSQVAGADPTIQAGGNATVTDAPSVSAAADNFVKSNFAGEYGAANVANTFDSFRKIIS